MRYCLATPLTQTSASTAAAVMATATLSAFFATFALTHDLTAAYLAAVVGPVAVLIGAFGSGQAVVALTIAWLVELASVAAVLVSALAWWTGWLTLAIVLGTILLGGLWLSTNRASRQTLVIIAAYLGQAIVSTIPLMVVFRRNLSLW